MESIQKLGIALLCGLMFIAPAITIAIIIVAVVFYALMVEDKEGE